MPITNSVVDAQGGADAGASTCPRLACCSAFGPPEKTGSRSGSETGSKSGSGSTTPKGFHPKARGCGASPLPRVTPPNKHDNPNGVAPMPRLRHNARFVSPRWGLCSIGDDHPGGRRRGASASPGLACAGPSARRQVTRRDSMIRIQVGIGIGSIRIRESRRGCIAEPGPGDPTQKCARCTRNSPRGSRNKSEGQRPVDKPAQGNALGRR